MNKAFGRINRIMSICLCSVILAACSTQDMHGHTEIDNWEIPIPEKNIIQETLDTEEEKFDSVDDQRISVDPVTDSNDEESISVNSVIDSNDEESKSCGVLKLSENEVGAQSVFDYSLIPEYVETSSVTVNDNIPFFTDNEREDWLPGTEVYSDLDGLGRCGVVYGCIGEELMPTEGEQREAIGMVKPSGWQTVKYPDLIEDLYLYNRCHLIGWQLGGENANECNLITGTRYLNICGMLQYENAANFG